ncbi:MAG TPA: hypothetical protein VML01_14075 [Bryobacterales bacterium]|nr:hypothetical protein [Bryobacterales bacterium]
MSTGSRGLWRYTVIVAGSFAAALVLAEVYLASTGGPKWNLPFYNTLYPYVMFRPPANLRYLSAEKFAMSHNTKTVHHYTNEDGLRIVSPDYELPKQKPPGQLRIAMLGGSTVEIASEFESTLPGSLKTVLRTEHAGYDIEVINAGIQSSIARQAVVHLMFTVVNYHPDIVIFYDGHNDLGLPLMYEARPNFPYNFQTMQEAWDAYRAAYDESLFSLILNRSYLYAAIRESLRGADETATTTNTVAKAMGRAPYAMDAEDILDDPEFVKTFVDSYLSNWRLVIDLSKIYGFQPVFVLQATSGTNRAFTIDELNRGFFGNEQLAANYTDAFIALYDEAGRRIEEMRTEYPDVIFMNIGDYLEPPGDYYWDGIHVFDEVNLKLAGRIHQDMRQMVESRLKRLPRSSATGERP